MRVARRLDLMYQHFVDLYWNSRSGQHAMADLQQATNAGV